MDTLQSHELRTKQFDLTVLDHAFQTQSTWDAGTSNWQRNSEASKEDETQALFKWKGKGEIFSQIKCFYCDKIVHTINYVERD